LSRLRQSSSVILKRLKVVVLAHLEPPHLFVLVDGQPELGHHHAVAHEFRLELVQFGVRAAPVGIGREALDTFHQHPAAQGTIVDRKKISSEDRLSEYPGWPLTEAAISQLQVKAKPEEVLESILDSQQRM
jgi:hypothetical protein